MGLDGWGGGDSVCALLLVLLLSLMIFGSAWFFW